MSVVVALLVALLGLFVGSDGQRSCEAISGQHADGTEVGVVVYGCAPEGVELLVVTR